MVLVRATMHAWDRQYVPSPSCIARQNASWGRLRIPQQVALLRVFVSASTVRNILNRPMPADTDTRPRTPETHPKPEPPKHIRADHPNHVWSADLTTVRTWIFFRTEVFAVIDHFSRKLVTLVPLSRPNATSIMEALDGAFQRYGCPKHFVTDKAPVFTGPAFAGFLGKHGVKHRTGAVGQHGSISITERLFESFKYEWLRRVPFIRGFAHLLELCNSFATWYGQWRPHQGIAGGLPDDAHMSGTLSPPLAGVDRSRAKTVPSKIETIHFADTGTTAWRIPRAA
ncbi:MAG: DDE-type integrase/transposase/recombinase [Acidobacteriota bacterium]